MAFLETSNCGRQQATCHSRAHRFACNAAGALEHTAARMFHVRVSDVLVRRGHVKRRAEHAEHIDDDQLSIALRRSSRTTSARPRGEPVDVARSLLVASRMESRTRIRARATGGFGYADNVFGTVELAELEAAILGSKWLGRSRLAELFASSLGFSVAFRRDGVDQLIEELPWCRTYVERVLRPSCNAFFLNPLVLNGGASVGAHVDGSLSGYIGGAIRPRMVSVLYVAVPADMSGGELIVDEGASGCHAWQPVEGRLLMFAGHLQHQVAPVSSELTRPRISLVCEQYQLDEAVLPKVPQYVIGAGYAGAPARATSSENEVSASSSTATT